MPTARWDRPEQLFGYLEEEERVNLEPLLGSTLYEHLCEESVRLRSKYIDITPTTITPTGEAKLGPELVYADVTERLDAIQQGTYSRPYTGSISGSQPVDATDMAYIRLIRICQQIEFYKMLSHKAGLLSVSFNEGGGMNVISADGYDAAGDKAMERLVKDAFMSAGRAVDTLLLFLESDAKGDGLFKDKWQDADSFYLHQDLLFSTARELNEYIDIHGERSAYIALVRDIRYCQNTYLRPRVGSILLKSVISNDETDETVGALMDELGNMLRTALAFYVEARVEEVNGRKLARRDSFLDGQQALGMACQFIEDNLEALGHYAEGSPIAIAKQKETVVVSTCRQERRQREGSVFTAFPMASQFVVKEQSR